MNPFSNAKFVHVPGGRYELGWRFTDDLPPDIEVELSGWMDLEVILTRFSAHRFVDTEPFFVSSEMVSFCEYVGGPYEMDELSTIDDVCNLLDTRLAEHGYRLPTEDELEVACGGSLFPWGMEWPEGIPYGSETNFTGHKRPSTHGLNLIQDPYKSRLSARHTSSGMEAQRFAAGTHGLFHGSALVRAIGS